MKSTVLLSALLLAGGVTTVVAADSSLDLKQRVERLERRIGHLTELTLEVEALKRENRQLQGRLEEQQYAISNLRNKQRELYLDLDQRISGMPAGAPAAAPAGSMAPVEAMPAPAPAATGQAMAQPIPAGDPAKEQATYNAAYDLLRPEQRRYSEAITAFNQFLQQYPNSDLADNAQYWLAEAYYVTQDNPSALAEFQELTVKYPESPKVPGALLKIGYIMDASGQRAEARKHLQQIVDKYPSSPAAGMAKQRLNTMR